MPALPETARTEGPPACETHGGVAARPGPRAVPQSVRRAKAASLLNVVSSVGPKPSCSAGPPAHVPFQGGPGPRHRSRRSPCLGSRGGGHSPSRALLCSRRGPCSAVPDLQAPGAGAPKSV